jgi:hypothetical protein
MRTPGLGGFLAVRAPYIDMADGATAIIAFAIASVPCGPANEQR